MSSFWFGRETERNIAKTLEIYIVTAIVNGGKWSSLEPHSLPIALLNWTIKQNRQNRNMGYVICIFALKVDFFMRLELVQSKKRLYNNVETLSSDKEKKQYTVKKKACNAHQIWCATFVPSGTPYMA